MGGGAAAIVMTPKDNRASRATTSEVRADQLLGRRVLAGNNQTIGRLEEFRLTRREGDAVVAEYVIGTAGLVERLGVGVRLIVGARASHGYVARWDQLDISDPERPRLTCSVKDLREE